MRVFAENISEIKQRIDSVLASLDTPNVYTRAAENEAKVLLLGDVKTSQEREKIAVALGTLTERVVDLLKVKEEESSIEIDVQVIELNKDATSSLGLTNPLTNAGTSGLDFTETGSPALTGSKWQYLFKVLNLQRDAFSWTLYAMVQEGKAHILSRPRLTCQSGKEAELLVGGEKPIFTTQIAALGGQGTSVEYKEYGIKMKIKPTVTEEGRIKLALNVEASEVGTAESIGTSTSSGTSNTTTVTARAYPLTKRNVSTEVYVNDGQIMAIGGLIKRKEEEDVTKTPFLGDVPLLGALFRRKVTTTGGGSGERGETELFIILSPKIVGALESAKTAKQAVETEMVPAVSVTPQINEDLSPLGQYVKIVQQRILGKLVYPSAAKIAGFQGTVKLSAHLSYDGKLLEIKVKEPSEYSVLDDAALTAANSVSAYPPFPAFVEQEELWIDIPVHYRLD